MDRNAPITSNYLFPKRSAEILTEQKNPKFLRSLRNTQHDTMNLAISNVEKSKESYPGLSSTTDESSDSRSDWTEDVDDADEGRSMMGTDP